MVGPDSSHGVSRVVHHKDFYLRGGDMTVLVENHLYRIHSYFFERESLFFRQKVSTSNTNGNEEERGSTDGNAYTLEDVKSEDFARFLWVFYNPKYSVYEAPLETWLSILRLANRWTFDNVKELSVRELEKIDIEAVEKIAIYHDNSISRLYLIPSYVAVCKRDKPLTFTEGMKLGMETVLRIAEARERLRQQVSESGTRSPTFEDFEDADVEILVRDIFNLGSRPTSPTPVTSSNGINGSANGTIKLNPAPPGNTTPKANGASAPRANGGSAADHRNSSVDSMPSIATMLSPQPPALATVTPTITTVTQATAPQETSAQAPPALPAPTASTSPVQPLPSPAPDNLGGNKETEQDPSSFSSLLSPTKPGGAGEPSSPHDLGAGSEDVSISKPVVPSSEHSNDLTAEPNDILNDESGKDTDPLSVFSDTEGGKGKQSGRKNRKRQPLAAALATAARGGKSS